MTTIPIITELPAGIPAISLWQPWATLVALGLKHYETRHWRCPERFIGCDVAIHSAKRWNSAMADFCRDPAITAALSQAGFERRTYGKKCPSYRLPLGQIVAVVRFGVCLPTTDVYPQPFEKLVGDYRPGRFAWPINSVRRLLNPIDEVGRQGFWRING